MPKQKNLTISDLKKMNSALNNKKRVNLDENYYIDMDIVFRNTKIQLILERILETNKYITENKIEKFDIISYAFLLAIKQFTTLQIEDDLSVELQVLDFLIDKDYFNKIIESFGEENLKLFFEKLNDGLKNVNIIREQLLEEFMKKHKEEMDKQKVEIEQVEPQEVVEEGENFAEFRAAVTSDTGKDTEAN